MMCLLKILMKKLVKIFKFLCHVLFVENTITKPSGNSNQVKKTKVRTDDRHWTTD